MLPLIILTESQVLGYKSFYNESFETMPFKVNLVNTALE